MISRWHWLLLQLTRKLWFRVSLFSVLAVATALVAIVLAPYIPAAVSAKVGGAAVGEILAVIATSMLAVTIFSLSTMVAAYIAANSNVTPRSIRLLEEDGTAQNALGNVLSIWATPSENMDEEVRYPKVHVPGIDLEDLFDDLFTPIARDGAGLVEVGMRLQKSLIALGRIGGPQYVAAARRHSALALERALAALVIEEDKQVLRALAAEVGTPAASVSSAGSFYTGPPAAGFNDVRSVPASDVPPA